MAGPGVTVDGNGSSSHPYVISSGAAATPTPVEAADTPTVDTTVSGGGTAADPYVVSAAVNLDPTPPGGGSNLAHAGPDGLYVECADVRGCISAGDGLAYDPATGEMAARPSTDAGNGVAIGTDGGLYAPAAGGAAVTAACGLTGDGTAADPLTAATGAWGFPCDLDTYAGQVYCDSAGQLRSEPRGQVTYEQDAANVSYPVPLEVPMTTDAVMESRPFTVVNPDPCRPATVLIELLVDADLNLPPGGGAQYGFNGDDVVYLRNNGTTALNKVHSQSTRIHRLDLPPGGSSVEQFDITAGDASIAGVTISRIQTAARRFIFNL